MKRMDNWTQEELDEMLKQIEFKLRDLEIQKAFVKHFMKNLK
jgi:hypothetical protein